MPKSRFISDLHWVREGQQTRSQKTQEALLDAAEALFSEQGADATSVAELRELTGDVLAPARLQRHGLLDAGVVSRLIDEHHQRRADHSFAIWSVLIFQLWYDRFVAPN